MDFFGIGSALLTSLETYTHTARQTGRTTRLINSLKDGDRVLVGSDTEQRRLKDLVKRRGLNVEIRLARADRLPAGAVENGTRMSAGRTYFEHTLVEQFYRDAITRTAAEIHDVEIYLSKWSDRHEETRDEAARMAELQQLLHDPKKRWSFSRGKPAA